MPTKTATIEPTQDAFQALNAGNAAVKETFDRAVGAFGDFNAFSKENVEAMVESMTTAGKGMEQINAHVMALTKTAVEESVTVAKRFASAKSVQELIELQTSVAKSSLDTYVGELNKMSDLYASTMKDAFRPINERFTAAVEMFQAQR